MRLFFSIEIPEEIKAKLREVLHKAKKLGIDASFVKGEQLHVTLLFLGEKTENEMRQIIESAKSIKLPKFNISIEGAGFFPNDNYIRVFWVGAKTEGDELHQLHEKLANATKTKPEKHFSGHITLARIKGKKNIAELIELERKLQQEVYGSWVAEEFNLKESKLMPQGATYAILQRFSLSG